MRGSQSTPDLKFGDFCAHLQVACKATAYCLAQLHSSGWMFYPWLALMLSSSYCSRTAWCNIKAAAQTKHIQAGSWGGKRETSQQSSHAGCFYFCVSGSELLVEEIL